MTKFDPLEENKVVATDKRSKKETKAASVKAKAAQEAKAAADEKAAAALAASVPDSPVAPTLDVAESPPEDPAEALEAKEKEEKPSKAAAKIAISKWRVMKDIKINSRGYLTTLPKGKVLSSTGYGGPKGIQKLINAGVELEQIK
jgi:hypothetical protein